MTSRARFVVGMAAVALSVAAVSAQAADVTLSGPHAFAELDGSALDADGVADGTFSVDGALTVAGSVECSDDPPLPGHAGACAMRFVASDDLTIAEGGALFAENRRGGGSGGAIELEAGGSILLAGPGGGLPAALVSSAGSSGNPSAHGGAIVLDADGAVTLAAGSVVSSASAKGQAGSILIQGATVLADGLVAAGPGATLTGSLADGPVLAGGTPGQAGGAIQIAASSTDGPSLVVGGSGVIVSQGRVAAGGGVALSGCGVEIRGLVASLAEGDGVDRVEVRSGEGILVDGRDFGAALPAGRFGHLRADALSDSAAGHLVDLFADDAVVVLGPEPGASAQWAVNARPGSKNGQAGGTLRAVSLADAVTASGNAFQAGSSGKRHEGGLVLLEAATDLALAGARIAAAGGTGPGNGNVGAGGLVVGRAYQGEIAWTGGEGDVRPTGPGVPGADAGQILLTACTAIDLAGTSFPPFGSATPSFPVTDFDCGEAAPELPDGALPLCNQPPEAVDDAYQVDEGGTLVEPPPGVLGNDTDPNGDPLTATLVIGPAHAAAFQLDADGGFTYQHDGGETTSDSFTYRANDGALDSNVATVTITVNPVNDPPVARDDAFTTDEDVPLAGNVLADNGNGADEDADGDALTVTTPQLSGPSNGTLALAADGSFTYTPNAELSGLDSFVYEVTDGNGGSDTATVTITVVAVDDPPVADPQAVATAEDTPLLVVLTGSDAEGAALTFAIATGPANGSLSAVTPLDATSAQVTYTPNADFHGADAFTFTVSDGVQLSAPATVTITIDAVDDAPVVVDDLATVEEDSGATAIDVLANDTDVDDGPIAIDSVTQPAGGTVTITNGGADLSYTPNLDFCNDDAPADTFTYTLAPGGSTATVAVTVTCVDDDPVAVDDAATVAEDSGATAIDVLANDTDVDGGALEVQAVTQPANGTVAIVGGGTAVTYTPNADYCNDGGPADLFTYTLAPGGSTATVTVTVTCVDDAPQAVDDAATVFEDSGANLLDVQANDLDPDGGANTIVAVTQPSNGTVAIINGGAHVAYTPNANYCNDGGSPDVFTYTLSPGGSTAAVGVSVACVNDPPVAGADAFDFVGNTELRVDLDPAASAHLAETTGSDSGVLDNDADLADGDPLTLVALTVGACIDASGPDFECADPAVGTVRLAADGSFSFEPAAGDLDGAEAFQYTVSDGTSTAVGTVTLSRHERVWYVDNTAPAGGDGTSVAPFDAVSAANLGDRDDDGDLDDDLDVADDHLFVHFGDGTAGGLSEGLQLEDGQHLLGEHVGLALPLDLNGNGAPAVLAAAVPGNRPLLDDVLADGFDGVVARDVVPAEIAGLDLAGDVNAVEWTTTAAFSGGGTLVVRDNVVRSAGAVGVDVDLAGSGSPVLAFHGNQLTATGTALDVQEAGSGTLTVAAFHDNAVSGDTGGSGVVIANARFDAVPGGTIDTVDGGTLTIGAQGDGVGGAGLVLIGTQGDLHFSQDLQVFSDGGAGITAAGSGALMLLRVAAGGAPTGVVEAIGGPAVDANLVTLDLRLVRLTSTDSVTDGVSLVDVVGTFAAEAGSAISEAGADAFRIDGGNANVTYGGTIIDDQGPLVTILGATGGTKSFTGAITDGGDGDGGGITLTGNPGATIAFSGGLTLSTGANPAFAATGGGIVSVSDPAGTDNTIVTTTGTALRVEGTTIGSQNLEFRSVSAGTVASGPANGIVLSGTGTLGGLKIEGSGSAGSGGTIQRATGAGISLSGTANVELSFMNVQNGGDDGIRGSSVDNLELDGMSIVGNGDAVGEAGIELTQLTGSGRLTNSTVSGSAEDNVTIVNTSGTLSAFDVTGSSFTDTDMTTGNDGFRIENNGSGAMSVSIVGSTFTDNRGDHVQVATTAAATGSIDFTFSGNVLTTSPANDPDVLGGGITVSPSGSADVTFTIDGNNLQQAFDEAINLNLGTASTAAAAMIGTVSNNVIGTAGDPDSGSESGTGISVISNGAGLTTVAIVGNEVRQYANPYGILLNVKEGSSNLNATVTGNTVANPGSFALNGIRVDAGATSGDSGTLCAAVTANSIAGSGPGADTDVRLRQRFNTTIRLPGYGGANNDTAAVNAFVAGNNPGSDVSSSHNVGGGGGGFVGGAGCPMP